MNKKENRMAVRQTVEKAVIRDEQNRRIQSAATNPVKEVLKILHTTLRGLEADTVSVNRSKYGTNKVTHEKKKSLAKRVAGAFINPFTAILFCLAFVSTITDMIFPYFSLFGSVPEDFDFFDSRYHFNYGIYFRYPSLCAGIPQRKCGGKAACNDHNHLYRHPHRTGKNRDTYG